MPKKQYRIDGVGLVTISKRRGAKNLRLSVRANGQVSLSIPYWTPYAVGEVFIKKRQGWINQQLEKMPVNPLNHGDLIGKNHRLIFLPSKNEAVVICKTPTQIIVKTGQDFHSEAVQNKIRSACESALKVQCEKLLRYRVNQLSNRFKIEYKDLRFRKLTSRWGSCSSDQKITLNIYLIQLPWDFIDYVISHELVHILHMNHSHQFWTTLENYLPGSNKLRKALRNYNPIILTD